MNKIEFVRESLLKSFPVFEWDDGVRVVTHCIYPGNGLVQVVVRGGIDTFIVSDEGGAFRELAAAGAVVKNPDSLVKHLITEKGVSIYDGVISSPKVNAESLGIAIVLVANASQEVAELLFARAHIKKERDFKSIVHQFLKARFNEYVKQDVLIGHSNKAHKFDNLIIFPNGKRLIVDPVMRDANSINARVVANLDVRSAGYSNLEQRIVYDDEEKWKPDELNLLQVGATVVPFSQAPQVLARYGNG